jgi:drug/metabolite transporter (DMT)-like permease
VFFNRRLPEMLHLDGSFGIGVGLLTLATFVWSSYGLAQKRLQQQLDAQQILVLVFTASIFVVWPFASPGDIARMSPGQLGALLFCGLNTLVAYGCFAESLKHWEVSRVGAILATTPLFTLASMWLVERVAPGLVAPERLNALAIFGALLVVAGSALCAGAGAGLGRSREPLPQ